ncbi:MAG: thiamine diphosphokinase [Ignavibacteria bacterium]|nr:thiamine diphosphokinase [Ignavibacteria bacterium]
MFHLIFDTRFDCVIALNSELPSLSFFLKYFSNIPIIGADGGAVKLFNMGLISDFVVGDLDTFQKAKIERFFAGAEIIIDPSQEINDFEKALLLAKKKDFRNILIVGFQGGELEHTLNNWSIVKKFQSELNLCIFEKGRYGIPINYPFLLDTKKEELISIIPQPFARLNTYNLRWNLNNEFLELGKREGARNVAENDKIVIDITEGSILLFIDSRLPMCFRRQKISGPDEIRTHDL